MDRRPASAPSRAYGGADDGTWYERTPSHTIVRMTPEELSDLAHLRRARDRMDREYAQPLNVPAMASAALMSPAHFSRKFRAAYGETPYSYLMTRRIERAKALLRQGMSVTDACVTVGCTSLGSFSSRLHRDRRRDPVAVPRSRPQRQRGDPIVCEQGGDATSGSRASVERLLSPRAGSKKRPGGGRS